MDLADLRIDAPRREPADVLVAQLAGRAAAGAPSGAPAAASAGGRLWRTWLAQAAAVAAILLLILGAVALGGPQDHHVPDPATTPSSTRTGPPPRTARPTPTIVPRDDPATSGARQPRGMDTHRPMQPLVQPHAGASIAPPEADDLDEPSTRDDDAATRDDDRDGAGSEDTDSVGDLDRTDDLEDSPGGGDDDG